MFLTGEEEIVYFCRMLAARIKADVAMGVGRFGSKNSINGDSSKDNTIDDDDILLRSEGEEAEEDLEEVDEAGNLIDPNCTMALESKDEQTTEEEKNPLTKKMPSNFTIYPLYSKLSLEEQQIIFEHTDPDNRAIVVATNIAETSLTISNIKYVIDTGKEKRKEFNNHNKIGKYVIGWVSQSSAN